ncbi:hypothetical protein NE237_032191 [Protea cynaroides]|uniref:Uncharacterized protein n=1 Tax=Protea cynaroides TaxID=273540 RepID=A0A9Q0L3S6_9MAGN|nr:hypothetical protein NE237_032191 [Protea cynaroides]
MEVKLEIFCALSSYLRLHMVDCVRRFIYRVTVFRWLCMFRRKMTENANFTVKLDFPVFVSSSVKFVRVKIFQMFKIFPGNTSVYFPIDFTIKC